MAKDQAEVAKDQSQLRTQAIGDYTSSGTTNQVTQMFSSDPNTSGIRSEYSSIATGNVTTTIDNLHTAQTQLQATQGALQQQQSQATDHRATADVQESQATTLAARISPRSTASTPRSRTWCAAAGGRGRGRGGGGPAAFNAKVCAAQKPRRMPPQPRPRR